MEQIEIPVGDMVFDARASGPEGGELVLLLHGFPQSSWCWRAQLAALGDAGYRAVAPDLRGYSHRARPEGIEAYRLPHLAADVVAMAEWLGGHVVHLVGHDFGAAITWQVAGRFPARLRTITPVSVPHPRAFSVARAQSEDQRQRSSYMDYFRRPDEPEHKLLDHDAAGLRALFSDSGLSGDVEEYVRVLSGPGAMTAALNYYRAMDPSMLDGFGPITTPTMYVWSTEDLALGREGAEATAAHVAGPYRFEVLEGVSHWIPEEAPDVLNRLLLEHLGG